MTETAAPATPPAASAPAPTATPPAVSAAPAPAAPAEIRFNVPAGVAIEPEYLDALRGAAGKAALSPAQAQAVLDFNLGHRAASAKAAADAEAAARASWDTELARAYPGPKLAEASDRVEAFVKTRWPKMAAYLVEGRVYRFPPVFEFLDAASAAAAESGKTAQAVAPAPAASADPNDWSSLFNHPTSKAAMAAEAR